MPDNSVQPKMDSESMMSTFCAYWDKFPEMKDAKIGETVELKVRGKVTAMRAPDKYSKGETTIEINSGNLSEEQVSKMSTEEIKDRLPKKED